MPGGGKKYHAGEYVTYISHYGGGTSYRPGQVLQELHDPWSNKFIGLKVRFQVHAGLQIEKIVHKNDIKKRLK